ncbi:AraC family transcriptional regulator [Actinoplanes sp. NPDC051851]|uniref:AraC family transcriptional regulator n=1 Tax=Actinoplanes sp. NPDC051851 TaxID=3154753 RepID=UPI003415031F
MDIIDAVVGGLRAGHAYGRRIGRRGAWGVRFPPFSGTGFHVVLSGDGWVTAAGTAPTAVHPGDVVLVPHGAEHTLSHAPGQSGVLHDVTEIPDPDGSPVDFAFLCGVYRLGRVPPHPLLERLPDVVVVRPHRDDQLRGLASLLAQDVDRARPGDGVTRAALIDLIVVHLLRRVDAWPAVGDPAIAPALDALHGAPQRVWTTAGLGATCGMSRGAFSRRFTAAVGAPPMTYLTRLRLATGARLLRETDQPLDAVARRVGYSTGVAFAHAFRREYGLAPGHFRRDGRMPEHGPEPGHLRRDGGTSEHGTGTLDHGGRARPLIP